MLAFFIARSLNPELAPPVLKHFEIMAKTVQTREEIGCVEDYQTHMNIRIVQPCTGLNSRREILHTLWFGPLFRSLDPQSKQNDSVEA